MENKDSVITIRVNEKQKKEFAELARELGWSQSQLIREAIKYCLNNRDKIKIEF